MSNTVKFIISIVVAELAGVIGSVFTAPAIDSWYANLVKPELSPPNWVFGPVWTTLFALMGIAAFLIWRKGLNRKDVKIALGLFIGQLALNALWSIIFFGLHSPAGAFVEIIFLWLAILATIIAFYKISRLSALLLLPYVLWVSFAGYLNFSIWQINTQEPVFCTQEAKLCPDGSYVGRIGPKCEFAQCPDSDNGDLWKTSTDSQTGISFKYPEKLLTEYIFTQTWPPQVVVSDGEHGLSCSETPAASSLPIRAMKRMVDSRVYCVKAESEGAAGSVYTSYEYSTVKDAKKITVNFILIYPQCDNYDDPQRTACKNERTSFDLDATVDRIVQSVKFGVK